MSPRRVIVVLILLVGFFAILNLARTADAQPAPADHGSGTQQECERYGCLYSHWPTHYCRGGCEGYPKYGIAHDRLPDGPDGRRYEQVLWPVVRGETRYDPARRAEWDRLANCESTLRWSINNGNGNGYHGGLQFSPRTWTAYGGGMYAAQAYNATPEQQIAVAERVLWAGWDRHGPQGRGAWPGCRNKGQGAPFPP